MRAVKVRPGGIVIIDDLACGRYVSKRERAAHRELVGAWYDQLLGLGVVR